MSPTRPSNKLESVTAPDSPAAGSQCEQEGELRAGVAVTDGVVRLVQSREVDENRYRSFPDGEPALGLDPPARPPVPHRQDSPHPRSDKVHRGCLSVFQEPGPHEPQRDPRGRRLVPRQLLRQRADPSRTAGEGPNRYASPGRRPADGGACNRREQRANQSRAEDNATQHPAHARNLMTARPFLRCSRGQRSVLTPANRGETIVRFRKSPSKPRASTKEVWDGWCGEARLRLPGRDSHSR
jgi:hypothetical protein